LSAYANDRWTRHFEYLFWAHFTCLVGWDWNGDIASAHEIANVSCANSDGIAFLKSFGGAAGVDYSQLIKIYGAERAGEARYSPANVIGVEEKHVCGMADSRHVSTSFVERQNLTMRMAMRRFTRLTNGFSKKVENHAHAIAIHYMHYNYCRIHQTLRVTPAMQAGLSSRVWEIEDLAALVEAKELEAIEAGAMKRGKYQRRITN
jgi:hypothetical protein